MNRMCVDCLVSISVGQFGYMHYLNKYCTEYIYDIKMVNLLFLKTGQSADGAKTGHPEKKHLTHPQAELRLSHT